MNNLFLLLAILLFPYNGFSQTIINGNDFGLDPGGDATEGIYKALQACRQSGVKKLVLPKNVYHFYPDKAYEKYCSITNNDNGLRRIGFPIIDFDSLEIDGQGSEFIFHGSMIPFVIEHSKNIFLKNFNIDFDKQFHLQGKVVAVDPVNKTFDVKISEENTYKVLEGELTFNSNGHVMNFQQNLFFDPVSKGVVYNVWDYKIDPWNPDIKASYEAEELGNKLVRITNEVSALPKSGWILVAKGRTINNESRYAPGFHINQSENIDLSGINIYHCGGMGLVAEYATNMTLDNFNVQLRKDSRRIISSTADATHFVNCKGNFKIRDCTFENMLDDATNFHSVYARIVSVKDQNTVGVKLVHHQQHGFHFAEIGDSIQIITPRSLMPKFSSRVLSKHVYNEEYFELTLEDELPSTVDVDDAIENTSWHPNHVVIERCIARQNRARGFLIYTRGKFEIRNNYFSNMMAGFLVSSGLGHFSEAGPVTDVLLENNTFENCSNSGLGNPVIFIRAHIDNFDASQDYYHHSNIRILGNTIKHFDSTIFEISNAENVIVANNKIIKTKKYRELFPNNPEIRISQSKNVQLVGNVFEGFKTPISVYEKDAKSIELQKPLERSKSW